MKSSIVSKIEKARRYAKEPERLKLKEIQAVFTGEHNDYKVEYKNGKWHCSCHFFSSWGLCSHTMALERILGNMLPEEALITPQVAP